MINRCKSYVWINVTTDVNCHPNGEAGVICISGRYNFQYLIWGIPLRFTVRMHDNKYSCLDGHVQDSHDAEDHKATVSSKFQPWWSLQQLGAFLFLRWVWNHTNVLGIVAVIMWQEPRKVGDMAQGPEASRADRGRRGWWKPH